MFCRNCGSENADNAVFCGTCGARFGNNDNNAKPPKSSKKLIIAIASVLVVALICTVLFFVLKEDLTSNVEQALENLQNQKQVDAEVDMDIKISAGIQNIDMEMKMDMKADITDSDNPLAAAEIMITANSQSQAMSVYYKDGYSYADDGYNKIKVPYDYEDYQKQYMNSLNNGIVTKADIDDADIKKLDNGDIEAKFEMSEEAFKKVLASSSNELLGDMNLELSDDSECYVTYIIDEDNFIKRANIVFNVTMDISGVSADVEYVINSEYNEIDDDFEVEFPDDLYEYTLQSLSF